MNELLTRKNVLITVMTYPHPSQKTRESVCTAGITENNEWVRLYPIDYRYRPKEQQFRKYQWIEVDLYPRGSGNDPRKESRKPELSSIKLLGQPIPIINDWAERRKIIDKMPLHTIKQLIDLYGFDYTSLGIVRPKKIHNIEIEVDEPEWKPEWMNIYRQLNLFGDAPKELRKIPYKFSYIFECDDDEGRPHKARIIDWELGVLFLKEAKRLLSDEKAAESVKNKFLNDICNGQRDIRFFMGTVLPHNSWIVLGVFWPPKKMQTSIEF